MTDSPGTRVPNVYAGILGASSEEFHRRDQELAHALLTAVPSAGLVAHHTRAFVLSATEACVRQHGMTQILDLGAGRPTARNVHDVAHAADPAVRICYVDHSRAAVAALAEQGPTDSEGTVSYLVADIGDPDTVLRSPAVRETIDLTRPAAVLLGAVIPYITDVDVPDMLKRYTDALAPGSILVLSHGTYDFDRPKVRRMQEVYESFGILSRMRGEHELRALMDHAGVTVLPPGIVATNQWRPDGAVEADASEACMYGLWGRTG
ncbi:SAM-dependent methyltransferase [Streptomyces buecherae]|uniref:SAM-dependent methyltransferase n=1 Tax=Streptomyces buecherae TaxID=2763006 RepID=UPI001C25C1DE|nr:SAM-dependent methyltransferase [Streptomyces buecherae]